MGLRGALADRMNRTGRKARAPLSAWYGAAGRGAGHRWWAGTRRPSLRHKNSELRKAIKETEYRKARRGAIEDDQVPPGKAEVLSGPEGHTRGSRQPGSLILPWIEIPNLGSHILAIVRRRLPGDRTERYGTAPHHARADRNRRRDPALHRRRLMGLRPDPCRNHPGSWALRPRQALRQAQAGCLALAAQTELEGYPEPVESTGSARPDGTDTENVSVRSGRGAHRRDACAVGRNGGFLRISTR